MKPINISLCLSNLAISRCQNTLTDLTILLNNMSQESLEYQATLIKEASRCLSRDNRDGLAAIIKCWEHEISEQEKIIEHARYLKENIKQDLSLAYKAPPVSSHTAKNDNRLLRASY